MSSMLRVMLGVFLLASGLLFAQLAGAQPDAPMQPLASITPTLTGPRGVQATVTPQSAALRSLGQPLNVGVSATAQWVDTGIDLANGDTLSVSATGSWTPGSPQTGSVGPDGSSQSWPDNFLNLADIGACGFCATTLTGHWAGLIGYVGNAPPPPGSYSSTSVQAEASKVFFVGSSFNQLVSLTGRLWLNFNDDAYSGITSDNSGQVSATISFGQVSTPTPGPSGTPTSTRTSTPTQTATPTPTVAFERPSNAQPGAFERSVTLARREFRASQAAQGTNGATSTQLAQPPRAGVDAPPSRIEVAIFPRDDQGFRIGPPQTNTVLDLLFYDQVGSADYLQNVLPNEWACGNSTEALKAGAITIKMYAWDAVRFRQFPQNGADVDNTVSTQIYTPNSANSSCTDATRSVEASGYRGLTEVDPGVFAPVIFPMPHCGGLSADDVDRRCLDNFGGRSMSQKGSTFFADQGSTYQGIIRRYFEPLPFGLTPEFFTYPLL